MKKIQTNWSKIELQAYILIFCADADFVEIKDEIDFIKSKIEESIFNKIHKEFIGDNDYQSIQKIRTTIEKYNYSEDEIERLYDEIKELFLSDGKYDNLERNLLMGLKRILS